MAGAAGAGLVSAMYLMKDNADLVRRWANEVNNQISSKSNMVQFHALCLLLEMRENDKVRATSCRAPACHSGLIG